MNRLNTVMLVGKIIPDSVVLTKEAGERVAEFSLRVTYDFERAKGELVREVYSIPCVAFGNVGATIRAKARKGREVEVYGRLKETRLSIPDAGIHSLMKVVCKSVR